jgi:hypothetical protein
VKYKSYALSVNASLLQLKNNGANNAQFFSIWHLQTVLNAFLKSHHSTNKRIYKMATKPTHNAVIVTGISNEGKDDEKKFYSNIGAAWLVETDAGIVLNADFDSFPTKTAQITFFPIKEKAKK